MNLSPDQILRMESVLLNRYQIRIREVEMDPPGSSYSPYLARLALPPPKGHRKPSTVYALKHRMYPHRISYSHVDADFGVVHEITHLVLWHSRVGVDATNEADCVVLEAAWCDTILGRGWGTRMAKSLGGTVEIPYSRKKAASGGVIGDWDEPTRTRWWARERQKLQRLGVLDERGRPTWRRANWSHVKFQDYT